MNIQTKQRLTYSLSGWKSKNIAESSFNFPQPNLRWNSNNILHWNRRTAESYTKCESQNTRILHQKLNASSCSKKLVAIMFIIKILIQTVDCKKRSENWVFIQHKDLTESSKNILNFYLFFAEKLNQVVHTEQKIPQNVHAVTFYLDYEEFEECEIERHW